MGDLSRPGFHALLRRVRGEGQRLNSESFILATWRVCVCVLTEGLNDGETSRHVIINILLYGKGNVDMIMMIVRDCYGSMQSHVVIMNVTA